MKFFTTNSQSRRQRSPIMISSISGVNGLEFMPHRIEVNSEAAHRYHQLRIDLNEQFPFLVVRMNRDVKNKRYHIRTDLLQKKDRYRSSTTTARRLSNSKLNRFTIRVSDRFSLLCAIPPLLLILLYFLFFKIKNYIIYYLWKY